MIKSTRYYTSGEFARKAKVTLRTVRYYDANNILKPSYVNEYGKRFYTDKDFVRLQQILLLKYLGFSLEDIRNITIDDTDKDVILRSMDMQLKLVHEKLEQMHRVENAIIETKDALSKDSPVDWNKMLDIIHLTNMEESLASQYKDSTNINSRISLHARYSTNPVSWYSWIYDNCRISQSTHNVLEVGCGNGQFWMENADKFSKRNFNVTLTDSSEGMVRDAEKNLSAVKSLNGEKCGVNFKYEVADCENLPYGDETFDMVIANHVLFYCKDIDKACREINRVLKKGGRLIASTYGSNHMKEISNLIQKFDPRIVLAAIDLYEKFGLENGADILGNTFSGVDTKLYEDSLNVTDSQPLIDYILSCHGNQNQYIVNRYHDFTSFVEKNINKGFRITKNAGVFIALK